MRRPRGAGQDGIGGIEFVAFAVGGLELEPGGLGEGDKAGAIGDGGGVGASKQDGAEGEVYFVDEVGLQESCVEFAAAFDEQAFDVVVCVQPTECGGEVDRGGAEPGDSGAGRDEWCEVV